MITTSKRDQNLTVTLENDIEVTLDKKVFASALDFPYHGPAKVYFDPPSQADYITIMYRMGYEYSMDSISQFRKGYLSPLWHCIVHLCIRSLTGKTGGTDQISKRMVELVHR